MEKVVIKGFVLRPQGYISDLRKNQERYGYHKGPFLWIYESKGWFAQINGPAGAKDLVPITIEFGGDE